MSNPYSGDPAVPNETSPSVSAGDTESEQAATAPESPSAPPDVNPDVVAQSFVPGPAAADSEAVAAPERPSLLDRIRAIEVRVFGQQHPADDGTDEG